MFTKYNLESTQRSIWHSKIVFPPLSFLVQEGRFFDYLNYISNDVEIVIFVYENW